MESIEFRYWQVLYLFEILCFSFLVGVVFSLYLILLKRKTEDPDMAFPMVMIFILGFSKVGNAVHHLDGFEFLFQLLLIWFYTMSGIVVSMLACHVFIARGKERLKLLIGCLVCSMVIMLLYIFLQQIKEEKRIIEQEKIKIEENSPVCYTYDIYRGGAVDGGYQICKDKDGNIISEGSWD